MITGAEMGAGRTIEVRAGIDTVIRVVLPRAGRSPSMTVTHPTLGAVALVLTPIAAPITISAASTDRRRLTASASVVGAAGYAGQDGEAYLITDSDGVYACRISRIADTDIRLAEPLPRVIAISPGTAQMIPATYTATVLGGVGQLGAAAASYPWQVAYEVTTGDDTPDSAAIFGGVLHVAAQPWPVTGLTHARLLVWAPHLAGTVPHGQQDLWPQIEAAASLLQGLLIACRPDIRPGDAIVSSVDLESAHALLTQYILSQDIDVRSALSSDAESIVHRLCPQLTIIDPGGGVPAPAPREPIVRGSFECGPRSCGPYDRPC